jgi:hypothetical protein
MSCNGEMEGKLPPVVEEANGEFCDHKRTRKSLKVTWLNEKESLKFIFWNEVLYIARTREKER